MKLTKRQKEIVEIVKKDQPVSGEKISELLDVSRATLRSDLSFLTLVGILKASPKVGYTYAGSDLETLFFFDTFQKKVEDVMTSPVLVTHDSFIQDAIITLFMYDSDVLYVIDEKKQLHFCRTSPLIHCLLWRSKMKVILSEQLRSQLCWTLLSKKLEMQK